MTERDMLLRSILTEPDEDTHRLVFADFLDENGEPEQAEFIRVQCELAKAPVADEWPACPSCDGDGYADPPPYQRRCRRCQGTGKRGDHAAYKRAQALARRQRELIAAHWREWAYTPESFLSASWPSVEGGSTTNVQVGEITQAFARGFVSEIHLPTAAFLEHAATIFAAHPVTRVVLAESDPLGDGWEEPDRSWTWLRGRPGEDPRLLTRWEVPYEIWGDQPSEGHWFESIEEAHGWLSRKCVAYGRALAGLPPLPTPKAGAA